LRRRYRTVDYKKKGQNGGSVPGEDSWQTTTGVRKKRGKKESSGTSAENAATGSRKKMKGQEKYENLHRGVERKKNGIILTKKGKRDRWNKNQPRPASKEGKQHLLVRKPLVQGDTNTETRKTGVRPQIRRSLSKKPKGNGRYQ